MKAMHSAFLILLLQFFLGCKQPEPETYLIPNGFKGKVNIIFNQPNGQPVKYENGRRVYEIPLNGILLTQFKDEYGNIDHKYYYTGGENVLLPKLSDETFKDSTSSADRNEVGIFYDGTVGVYGNSDDPKALHYQEFYVSDFSSLDDFFKPENQEAFKTRLKDAVGYDF